jgi:hypothetical protein
LPIPPQTDPTRITQQEANSPLVAAHDISPTINSVSVTGVARIASQVRCMLKRA